MAQGIVIKTSKEINNENQKGFNGVGTITASQSLSTLILSIFATTLIACGKLISERQTIAIKLANGASRKSIIIDCIFEMIIFSIIAVAIDLAIIYLLQKLISNIIFILFNYKFMLFCFAISIVFSIITGVISGIGATRFNVAKLLK